MTHDHGQSLPRSDSASPGPAVPGPAGSPGRRGPQLEHRDVVHFVPVSTAELSRPRRPCPVPLQYRAGRRSRSASESTTAAPNAEHGPYRTTSTCRGEKPTALQRRATVPSAGQQNSMTRPASAAGGPDKSHKTAVGAATRRAGTRPAPQGARAPGRRAGLRRGGIVAARRVPWRPVGRGAAASYSASSSTRNHPSESSDDAWPRHRAR